MHYSAAITNVWGLLEKRAFFLCVIRTMAQTRGTGTALGLSLAGTFPTDIAVMIAMRSVKAIIEWPVRSAFLKKEDMGFDLFGDGSTVLAQMNAYCLEGKPVGQIFLDNQTIVDCQMFILIHEFLR